MKQKELTQKEKESINGGNQTSNSATEASISSDSLLSINQSWSSGDKGSSHTLEIGKGIDIDLGGNLSGRDGN
jgi:hypothetical protein